MYNRYIKRLLAILISLVSLILFSWLFALIAVVIKLTSPGPVLFRQKRVCMGKQHFEILKFRTMYIDAPKDTATHLLSDPNRYITPIGRFLRKTSLDELPQLINILRGEMALVGPRPALWNQYDLIAERDRYGANDIRPGLTGWAQINGRDELETEVKARFDGEYVEKMSLLFDFRILLGTVVKVLRREGIRHIFGLDYGYTNDPTAFIAAAVDEANKRLYIYDEHYEKRMLNEAIAAMIREKGYHKERIRADAAEPKSNDDLRRLGIGRLQAAAKGRDSVLSGIVRLQEYRMVVHPRCVHTAAELAAYTWQEDGREGVYRNVPCDRDNHLMDALRYAMEDVPRLPPVSKAVRRYGPPRGGWAG